MKLKLFILLTLTFILIGCKNEIPTQNEVRVISYNLQNFFDAEDNGCEYEEFQEGSKLWNDQKYEKRVDRLFELLKTFPFSSSSVIFFEEIENDGILKTLLVKGLAKRGFLYYGCVNSGTPLSIGFISKIKPNAITSNATDSSRAVLGFETLINNEQVIIYAIHAKSQLGDVEEGKRERKKLASLLKFLVQDRAETHIIILGDFNEQFSVNSGLDNGYVPVGVYSKTEIDDALSLAITGDERRLENGVLYSPFLDSSVSLNCEGTYYYKGEWSFLDNVLLSSSLKDDNGLEFKKFYVINNEELLDNGIPYRYDMEKGKGYSDHLPLCIELGW